MRMAIPMMTLPNRVQTAFTCSERSSSLTSRIKLSSWFAIPCSGFPAFPAKMNVKISALLPYFEAVVRGQRDLAPLAHDNRRNADQPFMQFPDKDRP